MTSTKTGEAFFSPFEIVSGKIQPKEDSIQVTELDHLDPEAISAADAVVMLQAHGIPCRLRFLVSKKVPKGIRLTKLPDAAPIPADKRGYVSFPLIQEVIRQIGKFEAEYRNLTGDEYQYLVDSRDEAVNDV